MYVIWGAAHGALLVIHKMSRKFIDAMLPQTVVSTPSEVVVVAVTPDKTAPWLRGINMMVTFILISATFILFRAPSMEDVGMMWHQILFDFHPGVAPQFVESYLTIVLLIVVGYILHITPASWGEKLKSMFCSTPTVVQAIALALVILLVIQVRQSEIVPFIYLQY